MDWDTQKLLGTFHTPNSGKMSSGARKRATTFDDETESEDEGQQPSSSLQQPAKGRGRGKAKVAKRQADDDDDDDDDEDPFEAVPQPAKGRGKANSKPKVSRKDGLREVAVNRAGHFAKFNSNKCSIDPVKASWPGPFSVARALEAKKRETEKQRATASSSSGSSSSGKLTPAERFALTPASDEYDKILYNIFVGEGSHAAKRPAVAAAAASAVTARNKQGAGGAEGSALSPAEMKSLLGSVERAEKEGLSKLGADVLKDLAVELAKSRRLNGQAVLLLATPGSHALHIPDCSQIEEDVLIQAMAQTGALREVSLRFCGHGLASDKSVTALLSHAPGLQSLSLHGLYKLPDDGLGRLLASCTTSLRHIDLSCNTRLGSKGLSSVASIRSLRSLVLDDCLSLVDNDLGALLESQAELEGLSLANLDSEKVTDASIAALLSKFGASLKELNLSRSLGLTDQTAVAIRQHCRGLRGLFLCELSSKFSSAALTGLFLPDQDGLLGSIGPLERIGLAGTKATNDDVVVQLVESTGRTLTSLDLCSCNQLTNKAAVAIATNCGSTLTHLDVSFVHGIEHKAFEHLASSLHGLRSLDVYGCTTLVNRPPLNFSGVKVAGLQ